jgi:hypothetical protein
MNLINGTDLKTQLLIWEDAVCDAIILELFRLNRTVAISELVFNPFVSEISAYTDGITLNEHNTPVVVTSFADTDAKLLSDCMSDSEIDSWGLLGLLDGLKSITK